MSANKKIGMGAEDQEVRFAFQLTLETLLEYLDGKLAPAKHKEVAAYIAAHPEEQDALTGLKKMRAKMSKDEMERVLTPTEEDTQHMLKSYWTRNVGAKEEYFQQPNSLASAFQLSQNNELTKESLAFISNFNTQLLKKRSLDDAYTFICETIKIVLNCRGVSIFIYAPDGSLERKYIAGFYKGFEPPKENFKTQQGFVGEAVGTRELYGNSKLCNELTSVVEKNADPLLLNYKKQYEEAIFIQNGKNEELKHIITSPLNAFRRSSGVLRVINKLDVTGEELDPHGFTEQDQAKLELIAAMSTNTLSYLKLEKRENVLNNVPNLLNKYGPEKVFDKIAESLINESTLYSICIIRLIDPTNRFLEIKGSSMEYIHPEIEKIMVEDGVTGRTFYSDTHSLIQNFKEDSQHFLYKKWAEENEIVTMICFPLKSTDLSINYGTLSVYSKFEFKFGPDDIKYLESFAKQLGRTIEHIQDDKDQRFLASTSKSLIVGSDMDELMIKTTSSLPQITGFDTCAFLVKEEDNLRLLGSAKVEFPKVSLQHDIVKHILANPFKIFRSFNVENEALLQDIKEQLKNVRSLVLIPITSSEKEVYGAIVLASLKSRELHMRIDRKARVVRNLIQKLNLDLLETIANLFACTIEKRKERLKKLELHEQLLEERNLLKTLIDNIPDLIYIKDLNHNFLMVNNAQAKILGLNSVQDAIGKSDLDFFDLKSAKSYHESENTLFSGAGKFVRQNDIVIDNPSGERKIFDTYKGAYFNNFGKIKGLVGIGRDITDLKAKEDQLKRTIIDLRSAKNNAERAQQVIKSQYEEFKYSVGILSKKLIDEYEPDSKVHIYARIIAADFFVERELFAKYLSKQSLRPEHAALANFQSVFADGFEQVIKLTPEALGESASVVLNLDERVKRNLQFDKNEIQDILLSLVLNAMKHSVVGSHPQIFIEAQGDYLAIKNDCRIVPRDMEELKRMVKAPEYELQGSTLFTIDKYFKENYDREIAIDYHDEKFVVGLPLLGNN